MRARLRPAARLGALLSAVMLGLEPLSAMAALRVVVLEGLGGQADYTRQFDAEAGALAAAARRITASEDVRLMSGPAVTRSAALSYFHRLAATMSRDDHLIVYLIGHGSFDGRQYKFNIPGPDLTDRDLAMMLDALPAQRQLVVATGSASGALLLPLRKPGRILITGTRNGDERNVTHFGAAFIAALTAPAADVNKDGTISAAEAFAYATRRVQDYFKHQALLASEHAVLQGNGGDLFTLSDLGGAANGAFAAGSAAGSAATGPATATRPAAALARRRDQLNERIRALEQRKSTLSTAQYAAQLDPLLLALAELQERIDQGSQHVH